MFVPMSTSTGTDQHCGSPCFELNQYGVMRMEQLEYFVGVDWSSADHQVCVVDIKGKVCAQRSFKHCGMGLAQMADWIVRTTQSSPHKVGVVIETPRGPVVESLMGRELVVYSINPKQLDRYRDRFSLAGAKDDRLDARGVGRNRAIRPQSPATSGCADARSGDATRLLASPWTVDCRQAASDQPDA